MVPEENQVQYTEESDASSESMEPQEQEPIQSQPVQQSALQSSPQMGIFNAQLIHFVESEMAQGYGLGQIRAYLVSLGYDALLVENAVEFVASKHDVSDAVRNRAPPRTDEHHVARKFHLPIITILLATFMLAAVFYFLDTDAGVVVADGGAPLQLYSRLGLAPADYEITSSKVLYSRIENVDIARAAKILTDNQDNVYFKGLVSKAGVADSIKKSVTSYTVLNKKNNALEDIVYVSLGFMPVSDEPAVKIIEIIPKSFLPDAKDVRLPQGGVVVEQDPIIQWKFSNVKKGKPLRVGYIIWKRMPSFTTTTFVSSVSLDASVVVPGEVSCGNGVCEVGESYATCCSDCGCLQNFFCVDNECMTESQDCTGDSDCDDHDPSTVGKCYGRPKKCIYTKITDCVVGDGYCPPSCSYDSDKDCPKPVPVVVERPVDVVEEPFETPEITSDCGDYACFQENFAKCSPSSLLVKTSPSRAMYYMVVQSKLSLCQIKIKVNADPNASFVGKEMVCNYQTGGDFLETVEDINTCSGPLKDLLTGKGGDMSSGSSSGSDSSASPVESLTSPPMVSVRIIPDAVSVGGMAKIEGSVRDVDGLSDIAKVSVVVRQLADQGEKGELYDDGSGFDFDPSTPGIEGSGDVASGDGVYSADWFFGDVYSPGVYDVDVAVIDKEGHSGSGSAQVTVS